jgi:NAD(P)-dependent dehydrogenase (short-subunit alcohol dehydrogenase family)
VVQNFEGMTAVVTGAASGIGFGLAERFAAEQMNVVMADVETAALEDAEDRLRAGGAKVLAVQTDVTDAGSIDRLAAEASAAFGPVHVLCNNAGVGLSKPIAEQSTDDWAWVINVNLWGVIHGLRAFLPGMLAHGQPGHVVNTGSMASFGVGPGMASYGATKAAVLSISESLQTELAGTQIGVSVLCPGMVATRAHQCVRNRPGQDPTIEFDATTRLGDDETEMRVLQPSDVAECVVDAIVSGRLYVFPHPEWVEERAKPRFDRILAAAATPTTPRSETVR